MFFKVDDWRVGLLFLGLFAIYFADFFVAIGVKPAEKVLALLHVATGGWHLLLHALRGTDFLARVIHL